MLTRRLATAVVVAVVGVVGLAGAPGEASAAPLSLASVPGACTDANGVTVVVDFTGLGGDIEVGCAEGQPTSGWDALHRAGFTPTGTLHFPGFVCRIDDRPSDTTESCVNPPPTTAYWSYWYSTQGGPWTYTSAGAYGRTPPKNSVDGWSFSRNGASHAPGIAPPARPVSTTTAAPISAPSTPAAPPPAERPTTSDTVSPTKTPVSTTPAPTLRTTPPAATSTSMTAPGTAAPTSTPPTGAAAATDEPKVRARSTVRLSADAGGGGTPWGVVGTAGGAAGLLALTFAIARHRRNRKVELDLFVEDDDAGER